MATRLKLSLDWMRASKIWVPIRPVAPIKRTFLASMIRDSVIDNVSSLTVDSINCC